MSVLNRDLLRFEHLLQLCSIKPACAMGKLSTLAYLQARSDEELEFELKRHLSTAMLKLHNDVQNESDWDVVHKISELEFYAQVYILNRRKMGELLSAAYLEGVKDGRSRI